jgi:hypothetical protein
MAAWPATVTAYLWSGDVDEAAHILVTARVEAPLLWVLQGRDRSKGTGARWNISNKGHTDQRDAESFIW